MPSTRTGLPPSDQADRVVPLNTWTAVQALPCSPAQTNGGIHPGTPSLVQPLPPRSMPAQQIFVPTHHDSRASSYGQRWPKPRCQRQQYNCCGTAVL